MSFDWHVFLDLADALDAGALGDENNDQAQRKAELRESTLADALGCRIRDPLP